MKIWRPVIVTLTATIVLLSVPAISSAADTSGVMAAINGAVAAFNKGDMKAWAATCAPSTSIIDDFAPNAWSGPGACADWWNAFVAGNKKNGLSWGTVSLGTAWHVTVAGNHAYTVFPATYTYKVKGKPAKDSGIFSLALTKAPGGWLITAWSWAQH
ncbi:MAG TPA: nuclear transport factor 2 family protein [Candidatus Cybelea sp.]|nr:nuclear transport factor 2 family protein [Candidatus Cybelea sp.]